METLSIYAQPFFEWLLRSTFQASIVVCLILLIQALLRNRLTVRWHYALWLILIVRMVLPWAPQSRFSIYNLAVWEGKSAVPVHVISEPDAEPAGTPGEPSTAPQTTASPEPAGTTERQDTSSPAPSRTTQVSPESTAKKVSALLGVLPLLWLAGALLLGGYILICNVRLWRAASVECPSTDTETLELLEECRTAIGLRIIVALVPSEKVNTPVLLGFVRPRLLVPKGISEKLSREELRYVFLHELAHVKRHDIALGWLTALLQVLHWFNPLVWLAFHRMRSNRESACDALVLSRMQGEATQGYGQAIVSLLEHFSVPQPLPGLAGILESKSQLKRRIAMITEFKNNSYRFSPLAVILIVILACVSLPDAKSTRAAGISAAKPVGGMTLHKIMDKSESDQPPRVSPDGKYFCEVRWKGKTSVLSVRELATGQEKVLVSSDDNCDIGWKLVISPDSKLIAYNWIDNERNTSELRVGGLNDSEYRVLYSGKSPIVLEDWSDDGAHILGSRKLKDKDGHEQSTEIVRISVKDGSVEAITTIPKERSVFGYGAMVNLSPDGRYIAYHARELETGVAKYNIFLFDIDKKRETILEHAGSNKLVGWTPDGKSILFTGVDENTRGLWFQRINGGKPEGNPKLIRSDIGRFFPIGLTRDGACYYISSFRLDTLSTASLDLRTGEVLSSPKLICQDTDSYYGCTAWSPDGKYLTYCRRGSGGSSSIHIRSLAGGMEKVIDTGLPWCRWIRWTPSGQSLIASWLSPGDGGATATDLLWSVHKIDVETGARTVLFKSDVGRPVRTQFSPDEKSLVYNAGTSLLVRDMDTGEERKIFELGESGWLFWWDLAPDGRSIAVGAPDSGSGPTHLKVISLEGKELNELLPPNWGEICDVLWAPDGRSILFTSQGSLWQIPTEGGEPRKLLASAEIGDGSRPTISLHPDGRRIALITNTYSEELWAIENFLPEEVARPQPAMTLRKLPKSWSGFTNISPDGRYLCDIDWNDGNLTICDLVTGKRWPVTEDIPGEAIGHYALEAAISPDSEKVAYLWYEERTGTSSFWLVGRDGSDHRLLCEGKYIMPKDWSADGSKILAAVYGRPHQMAWVSASDGSIQKIKDLSNEYPGKFDVSPDGCFIAYDMPQADDTPKRDVFLYDIAEERDIHLIESPADDMLLGWTPDGKSIFFSSDRTGTWDGWLLDVRDGKPAGIPQRVKKGMGKVESVGFRSNGDYYFGVYDIRRSVFTASFDPDTCSISLPPSVVRQTGSQNSPDWSPDGKYLAYFDIETDNDNPVICIRSVATGQEREIDPKLAHVANLLWAPDGRSLLATGSAERNRWNLMIYQIDAQTGKRTELVRSEHARLMAAEWLPDGKRLLYSRFTGSDGTTAPRTVSLVIRDIDTGNEKDLVRVERPDWIGSGALSPDGRHLAVETTSGGITLVSVDGGQTRELLGPDQAEKNRIVACWSPDGRYILLLVCPQMSPKPTRTELWRIAAAGGQPEKLQTFRQLPLVRMQIHPSGKQVALCTHEGLYEMWVMENFLPEVLGK